MISYTKHLSNGKTFICAIRRARAIFAQLYIKLKVSNSNKNCVCFFSSFLTLVKSFGDLDQRRKFLF